MSDVVRLARGWIGTPFVHRAALRGAGCDCLGLVRGVLAELTGAPPVAVPLYAPAEDAATEGERLWHGVRAHLNEVKDAPEAIGDVLLFRLRTGKAARHLGILSATGAAPAFIHAYHRHGVVETPLSDPWRRRIVARFSLT